MSNFSLITQIVVACGAALLLLSIFRTRKILFNIRHAKHQRSWRILIGLMFFFFSGYLVTVYYIYVGEQSLLNILTAVVFLFGGFFVFLVVNVGYNTILRLNKTVDKLEEEIQERKKIEAEQSADRVKLEKQNDVLLFIATSFQITKDDLAAAFRQITEKIAMVMNVERVGIWIFNNSMSEIECVEQYEKSLNKHTSGVKLTAARYPKYFTELLLERVINADDANSDERTAEFSADYLKENKITSMLDAPIRAGGKLIGIVCHENVGPLRHWTHADQYFAGSVADMTAMVILNVERLKAEKKLRKSEERFRKLTEATFEGIAIHDNGTIVEANSALEKMFGYTEDETVGRNVLSMTNPEDEKLARNAIMNGATAPVELTGVRKDKTIFEMEVQGASIEYNGKKMGIAAVRDISIKKEIEKQKIILLEKLKKAQVDLQQSLSLIRAAMESTADGIVVVDIVGKITNYNRKFIKMWNIPDYIISTNDQKIVNNYIINQLQNSEEIAPVINRLDGELKGETMNILELKDERTFELFSKAQEINAKPVGRVWCYSDITQQKQTQNKLKKLNQELEEIVHERTAEAMDLYHNAPAGYHSLDRDGKILQINDTELKWFGYTREEMVGKPITDFLDEREKKHFLANFVRLKNDDIIEFEIEFIKKDNSPLHALVSASSIKNEKGEVERIRSIVIDITEKKKLESEIRKTEERYRKMIESAGDVMYTIDLAGHFTYINPKSYDVTGYLPEELIGKHYIDLIAPEWKERVQHFYKLQIGKKIIETLFTFPIITKSGKRKWVEQTVIQIKEGDEVTGYQSIVRDITERIKTQEELKLSEERYRSLAENAPVLIINLNREGVIKYINRVRQIDKFEDVVGSNVTQYLDAEYIDLYKERLSRVFNEGATTGLILKAIRLDNSMGWYSTLIAPIRKGNTIESAIAISLDITEQVKAEEEIKILNAELNEKIADLEAVNKDLEAFTYSVSHDLRAPLRIINGFASILKNQYEKVFNEEGKKNMDTILKSVAGMAQLIDDLLAFSRLGRKEFNKTEVDMKKVVEDVIVEVDARRWNTNTVITLENILPANGDKAMLHQVVFNLLTNALKFSHLKDRPVVEIGSYNKDGENIYFVKDNGVGFDMKYYEKLFKVFSRLHSPAEFEGSGVGLAIVQRIISKHGGKVWAVGKLNEGATFYFSLPATKKAKVSQDNNLHKIEMQAETEEEVPGE